ncbi:collagenase [Iodobacter sp.]|uniref:collagenase n=1 Tax=Iodobacter sp. TaxID=1915058 RepID=UPI0025D7C62B|nr:collagenase [Iodobacter sp.]
MHLKWLRNKRSKQAILLAMAFATVLVACVTSEGEQSSGATSPSPAGRQQEQSEHAPVLLDPPQHPYGLPPRQEKETASPVGAPGRAAGVSALPVPVYAECDQKRLFTLSGAALAQYVATLEGSCMNSLFEANASNYALLSASNMQAVAQEARLRAQRWQPGKADGLWPLATFLKAGYYTQFSHAQEVGAYGRAVDQPVMQVVSALADNPALWLNQTEDASQSGEAWKRQNDARLSISETMILADSVRSSEFSLPLLTSFFAHYQRQFKQSYARYALHPMQTTLFNLHGQSGFADQVAAGQLDGLVSSLAALLRQGRGAFEDEQMFLNTVRETGRFMLYPKTTPLAEPAVALHLNAERFSAVWAEAVYALKTIAKVPCDRYNLCNAEAELKTKLFPNRWQFDNGNLVFETPLSRDEVEPLYYAMKQVEAQLKRVSGVSEPVKNDPNPRLRMVVYGTKADYGSFQGLLNGLSTDNGGIYIENGATFYTYQRTSEESSLSLEELVRHEYVHYLSGRFIQPGMWGTGEFSRDSRRLPWYDEGFAEFMAWSTSREGIKVRGHVVEVVASNWPASYQTPAQIMRSSYSDGWDFYSHSALWFYFLHRNEPGILAEVLQQLRNDDVKGFDALVKRLSADTALSTRFKAFVDQQVTLQRAGQLGDTSTLKGKDWLPQSEWQLADPALIQNYIARELPLSCRNWASGTDSELHRFECTGSTAIRATTLTAAHQESDALLNKALINLQGKANNFIAVNCFASDYQLDMHRAALRCEGPLAADNAVTPHPTGIPVTPPPVKPTVVPTPQPTARPTAVPTSTPNPTVPPTTVPTARPSPLPTQPPSTLALLKTRYSSTGRCLRVTLGANQPVDRFVLVNPAKLGRINFSEYGSFTYRRDQDQPGLADSIIVRLYRGQQYQDIRVVLDAKPVDQSEEACWAAA